MTMDEPRRLAGDNEAHECAQIMASSEPWVTLGRNVDSGLAILRDPTREVYLVGDDRGVAGFVIICMTGAFVGYIQSVAVRSDVRGCGLGSRLVAFAEQRILRDSPNVFICVSSFNTRARALYTRLGYSTVGELSDYIVAGHSELLLRKTVGPITGFRAVE
jgi:ribosomal-protein-alanine N-acetyltransferase